MSNIEDGMPVTEGHADDTEKTDAEANIVNTTVEIAIPTEGTARYSDTVVENIVITPTQQQSNLTWLVLVV